MLGLGRPGVSTARRLVPGGRRMVARNGRLVNTLLTPAESEPKVAPATSRAEMAARLDPSRRRSGGVSFLPARGYYDRETCRRWRNVWRGSTLS